MSSKTYVCRTNPGKSKRGCGSGSKVLSDAEARAWARSLEKVEKKVKAIKAEIKEEVKELKAAAVVVEKEVKKLTAARKKDDHARDKRVNPVTGKKRSHHKKKS